MKTLILIENDHQLRRWRTGRGRSFQGEPVYCALTPFAEDACRGKGIDCTVPEDYYTIEDYCATERAYDAYTRDLIALLNGYSIPQAEEAVGFPFEIGTYFAPLLSMLLGGLCARAYQLNRIITAEQPDEIVGFRLRTPLAFHIGSFLFHPLDTLYGYLLDTLVPRPPLSFIEYGTTELLLRTPLSMKERLRIACGQVPLLSNAQRFRETLRMRHSQWHQNRADAHTVRSNRTQRILFLNRGYNWDYLIADRHFTARFHAYHPAGSGIPASRRGETRDIFAEWFSWNDTFCGCRLRTVLYDHMAFIRDIFAHFLRTAAADEQLLNGATAVCGSFLFDPREAMLAHRAREKKIPVIMWAHGEEGCSGRIGTIAEMENMPYTGHFLTYGEGAARSTIELARTRYPRLSGHIYPVGAPLIDASPPAKTLSAVPAEKEHLLYVTGKFFLNATLFGGSSIPLSDHTLYTYQQKIIAYLETLTRHQSIWKLHALPIYGDTPVRTSRVKKIRGERSFVELLDNASLVILDSPSTTLLQAAVTTKPVFILLGYVQYAPETISLLERRAVIARSPEELIMSLDRYLKQSDYPADVHDRSFVKAFATHIDDGKSTGRAIDLLTRILKA